MEAIVAAHESAMLRYAARVLGSPAAAQDVVQNAFIKLFREWKPGMHPTQALRRWLYRVAHNEAVDHLRRESRLRLLLARANKQRIGGPARAIPGTDPAAERTAAVLAELGRLPLAEPQVVLLRLPEGLSYKDISRVTGRTEGNVGCLLHNAVKRLSRMVRV